MQSGYDVTAQFYDVMAAEVRADVLAQLAERLKALPPPDAPAIDVGAGTGLATQVMGRCLPPDLPILALEPNPVMRAALMTRIWDDPNLRPRTTLLPFDALSAPLPDRIGLAVLAASIHHFDAAQRLRLLTRLTKRLVPGGVIMIEIQCPLAIDIPETRFVTANLGSMIYEGTMSAVAIGEDRQAWTMTYVSRLSGAEIESQTACYQCWAISADNLIKDAAPLRGEQIGAWVLLHG